MLQNFQESLDLNDSVCQNLLNNLPGMFFRCLNDDDRTVVFVSNGCNELTGYSPAELCLNQNIPFYALLHPEDTFKLKRNTDKAITEKSNCNTEYRILCRKGKTKWVNEISNGVYDGDKLIYIEGYIRDITSERESSKLNSMLNTYQNAVNSGSLVSITDPKGQILFANDQFCKYSKYSRKELIGQNHRIVNSKYHSDYFFIEMWTTLKSGDTWRGEIRNKAKDGSYYWVDTVITPVFDTRHKIVQYLSIRNIITEKKENEFALIKKQEDLTRAVEEIKNRFNEMMQFNYIVSHNLRAPVANVLGLANLLKNNDIEEIEKKSLIESIHFSTLKIDEVLSDLNLILSSKSDINKTKDHISLLEIIGSVFETLNIQHEEKLNHFSIDIESESEKIISTKSYIESIFYNLISNAIKYKSLERNLEVKIKISKLLGALQIVFSDNGIGIDMERHGKSIFGLYKRFNTNVEGKGLGLHMTKTQIESLGGNILVESKLNEGTTFTITIPASFEEKH